MVDEEILWYKCPNDACILYGRPQDVFPNEEAKCPECGWILNAMYPG